MPIKGQRIKPEIRFWKMVDVRLDHECWNWLGCITPKGYGAFRWSPDKNNISSHRASWQIAHGRIPTGLHVLHNCNNPTCVNPKHLRLGTNYDNMQDKKIIGTQIRGETSGRSKLKKGDVLEIKKLYRDGGYTQLELGKKFNISKTQIGYIVRCESWVHLNGDKT